MSALEEYEREKQAQGIIASAHGSLLWKADAMRDELLERIEELEDEHIKDWAEVKRAWAAARAEKQRADEAEATVERLKVCGICHFWDRYATEHCTTDEPHLDVAPGDNCHFIPSRWQERVP